MNTARHPGKVLHGLQYVPDEGDVACNLLQDIKKHSKYCVVEVASSTRPNAWHLNNLDVACGIGEEVCLRDDLILSSKAHTIVSWIVAIRDMNTAFSKDGMPFQPFQNLMIMDLLFYLIMRVCPTEMDNIIHHCKGLLGLKNITTEEIRTMKKQFSIKHSTYIIPRRHGKTSMFTFLMAATVLFIEDIRIGYGCHRCKPLQETFVAAKNVMRNLQEKFRELRELKINTKQGERIHSHNKKTGGSSTILFISLQNDKVTVFTT